MSQQQGIFGTVPNMYKNAEMTSVLDTQTPIVCIFLRRAERNVQNLDIPLREYHFCENFMKPTFP
jgi:hypothetical protein